MTLSYLMSAFSDSSFVRLFTDMNPWTMVFFILGIIFVGIEMIVPGFGFFGIGGTVMLLLAVVLRMINGGNAVMLLYMIVILSILYVLLFIFMGKMIKKAGKSHNSIFNSDSSVPEDKTEGTKDFSFLVGKVGSAQTLLRPVGRVMFDNQTYDCVARDGFIAENSQVVVVNVEGQRIVVVEK